MPIPQDSIKLNARYEAMECADSVVELQKLLASITQSKGEIVNIMWLPERQFPVSSGSATVAAGYVVVVKFQDILF